MLVSPEHEGIVLAAPIERKETNLCSSKSVMVETQKIVDGMKSPTRQQVKLSTVSATEQKGGNKPREIQLWRK